MARPRKKISRRSLLAMAAAGCAASQKPPIAEARIERDVVYRAGSSHPKHRLDAYLPGGDGAPIVVFVHGGYWISGDRRAPEHGAGLYENVGRALSGRGVATVVMSYRLAPEVAIEAMLDDVTEALAWVRAQAARLGGDGERVAIVGHSAGGLLAALAACRAGSGVTAVGVLSGIWDVADMRAAQPRAFNETVTTPVFGAGEADGSWSPMNHLAQGPPRWLVAIAEDDFAYMIPQARTAERALRALGRETQHLRLGGYDHLDVVRRFGAPADGVVESVARLVAR